MLPIPVLQLNLGNYLKDNRTDLSILVDRAVGGSSISDGELKLCSTGTSHVPKRKKLVVHTFTKGLKLLNFSCCYKRVGFYQK
jgi:hypothetical protein